VPYRTLVAANSSNPFNSVSSFFKSATWQFLQYMMIFFLVVVWLACAYWIFKDARRRIEDRMIITVAVLTGVLFGPFGLLVYAIVRPPEYLEDIRERELEIRMMEDRMGNGQRCSYCKTPVRDDFLVCPNCMRRLRAVCHNCQRPLEPTWRVCPYCESPVATQAPSYERTLP
jgi:RNA polymerase subunit RPABC4/transcription elongation factor Spt4